MDQRTDPRGSPTELTVLTKTGGGPLGKRIFLDNDKIVSDGNACYMTRGRAERLRINGIGELSALIEGLTSKQAIALGALHDDLPDEVRIVTKAALANGVAANDAVARTAKNLVYRPGRPALAVFDYDTKGMPRAVRELLASASGFWAALVSVIPALAAAGYLIRLSTSAGLSRIDTGEKFPGSGGLHVYVTIKDGADAVRFLTTLHARCWLASLGWMVVGKAGQLLERSIIDRMVGAAERLVFEGPPVVVPPLVQDAAARKPEVVTGDVIDSLVACPPLSIVEQQRFEQLKAQARLALAGECAAKRAAWIASRAAEMTGMSVAEATAMLEKQADGLLLSSVVLEFDDPELAGTTVGDVLDDPVKYAGETMADPIEGREDRPCKAIVMIGDDGVPFINSFALGHTIYRLRYDASAVRARLAAATDAVAELVRLDGMAELNAVERTALVQEVARGGDAGVRDIRALLKVAAKERGARRNAAIRQRAKAERSDPRPQIVRPAPDADWLPVVGTLDAVADAASLLRRPRRDIDGTLTLERRMPISRTHAFTSANEEDDDDCPASS
jgi:hypothetical protein